MTAASLVTASADTPASTASPFKLGQFILGIALLAILFGGVAYGLWKQFGGPRQSDLTEVQPSFGQRAFAGAGFGPRRGGESVVPRPNGLVANAGEIKLNASKPPKANQWKLLVTYSRGDLMTPDQNAAMTARNRLPSDAAFAKSLNVSSDQIAKLNAIAPSWEMALTDDDKSQLVTLVQAYQDAKDKAAASTPLIKHLEQLGPAKLAATRSSIADRANQIRAILTPQQVDAFKPK